MWRVSMARHAGARTTTTTTTLTTTTATTATTTTTITTTATTTITTITTTTLYFRPAPVWLTDAEAVNRCSSSFSDLK